MNRPVRYLTIAAMVFAFSCVVIGETMAQSAPTPARKTEALQELNTRLKDEKSRAEELKGKAADAQSNLETTRTAMRTLTTEIQDAEETLTLVETRIKKLQSEKDALTERLERDYGSISELILALQRIRRVPTETLILRPGAPLQTAQSAMLLQGILPAINTRVEAVSADLNHLHELSTALDADHAAAKKTSATLAKKQADLKTMLARREALYRQSQSDYKEQTETVTRIAAEAKNLQELMAKIEKAERDARTAAASKTENKKPPRVLRKDEKSLPSAGEGRMPASGTILARFGQPDHIGAKSEGIKIQTRSGAVISAPMGGIVRFAGTFKNYGNMVIIEHQKGYHSLVAGMSKIDTVVGRRLNAGEPVGSMSSGSGDSSRTLYYELRHNGKPVDPSRKIPGLS